MIPPSDVPLSADEMPFVSPSSTPDLEDYMTPDTSMSIGYINDMLAHTITPTTAPITTSSTTTAAATSLGLLDMDMILDETKIEAPQDLLREFMRVQGALKSLTQVLKDAASLSSTNIDVVETICRLLFQDVRSQEEFKKMDGYTIFQRVLERISPEGTDETTFLQDLFSVFFMVALDGNTSQLVGNLDVLELLFRIMTSSQRMDLRREAVGAIVDLCGVNTGNAILGWKVGVERVFESLESCIHGMVH